MEDQKQKRRNALQNIVIVLLTVSAVFLFTRTQLYSLGVSPRLDHLGQSGSVVSQGTASSLADLAAPVRLVVTNSYGRYGNLFLTTKDDAFSAPGTLLGAALGSSGARTACKEADFRAALNCESLYCDVLSPLPLSILGGFLGVSTQDSTPARRLLLSAETDGTVALYFWNGDDGYFRCATAVAQSELTDFVNGYEPGSAAFAMDNREFSPDYAALDPYSLFVSETPSLPVLYGANPLSDTDDLLSALGFNPRTNYRYSESNGTDVVVEGDSSVRIQADGTVLYQSGTADVLHISCAGEVPTLEEAVVGVRAFLGGLTGSYLSSASLYLQSISQSGASSALTFGYQSGGVPIRFSDGALAAEVHLSGGTFTSFSLRFRQYTAVGQTAGLLPPRQAAAIAAAYPGAELSIGYSDSGTDRLSPSWLADQ